MIETIITLGVILAFSIAAIPVVYFLTKAMTFAYYRAKYIAQRYNDEEINDEQARTRS